MRCKGFKTKCNKEATVYLNYANLRLCDEHFSEYILRRMIRTIKRYKMLNITKDKVIIALSGGKDSTALLHLMVRYYNMVNEDIEVPKLEALHINLGIEENDYSEKCHKVTKSLADMLDVPYHYFKLKNLYGFNLSNILDEKICRIRKICSICGMIKRYLLNKLTIEIGATKIATGHLLDDESANLMKNLIFGDYEALIRISPALDAVPEYNLAARIKPLYEISEYETEQYVKIHNLPYISEKCPNASSKAFKMKNVLRVLENSFPNSRYLLMKNFLKYYQPALKKNAVSIRDNLNKCKNCGQPTSIELCSFCRLIDKLKK